MVLARHQYLMFWVLGPLGYGLGPVRVGYTMPVCLGSLARPMDPTLHSAKLPDPFTGSSQRSGV